MKKLGYTIAALMVLLVLLNGTAVMAGIVTDGIEGRWKGILEEADYDPYPIKLNVEDGRYRIDYPTLGCSSRWTLIKENEGSATFRESLRTNPGNCLDNTVFEVYRMASDRLKIIIYNTPGRHIIGHGQITCESCQVAGGWTTRITPSKIVCQNVTTETEVIIEGNNATWNCEDSGLTVRPDDEIQQIITGTAK